MTGAPFTRAFVAATTIFPITDGPPAEIRRPSARVSTCRRSELSGVERVIGVDTSSRFGKEELEHFGEITAISDEVQPYRIYVVYCYAA